MDYSENQLMTRQVEALESLVIILREILINLQLQRTE